MRILYLVPHVPNPTKARSYFHIRGLLDAGHEVTIATIERTASDQQRIQTLRDMGAAVLSAPIRKFDYAFNAVRALALSLPLQATLLWSPDLMRQIESHIQSVPPDVIHVEHLRMAQYGLRLNGDWPIIWDAVDYLSPLFQDAATVSTSRIIRWFSRFEAGRLARHERWLTGQFPATLVISRYDQRLFQQDNSFAGRVQVALPGLPLEPLAENASLRFPATILMTGTLNYHPNVASALYFVNRIFPLIRKHRPDVRLQLVGANPTAEIKALQNETVEVTGFVPSVTDNLSRATLAVAPVLYAAGMQNKVLEAFLTATPLVATSIAVRGLDVRDGEHALIADTPESFADAVLKLLDAPELRQKLGEAGRRYIEQNHDLRKTTEDLVQFYSAIC
jgi:glycosyltransferase involved in cell wall biosynthesis